MSRNLTAGLLLFLAAAVLAGCRKSAASEEQTVPTDTAAQETSVTLQTAPDTVSADGQLIASAQTREDAQSIAELYGIVLVDWGYDVAKFYTDEDILGTDDENGHGTHVAGIIAATMDNGNGGAGIAPDVSILNIRVLGADGSGDIARIARGINAAVEKGADVINLSLGGYFYNGLEADAVKNAIDNNVCVVAAMGNDGSNTLCYPAGYPGVIAVGCSDPSNNRAFFSNYGTWLDVSAPGWDILSTSNYGDYEYMRGTSQATPVVSGVVALYKSYNWGTPAQIEARLKSTATKAGSNLGAGIVNAARMLSLKPAAPGFLIVNSEEEIVFDSDGTVSGQIPCESTLQFYQWNGDQNYYILYTLDGSTPAVKNGTVVKGIEYEEPIDLSAYAGKTITVKAIQVNGMGMASPVLTKKIKVNNTALVTGVTVSGPTQLIAGKSAQFTAVVEPAGKASQTVTWAITERSPNMAKAKISTKGLLTTPGLAVGQTEGTVTIQATSKDYPDVKSKPVTVTVERLTPVAKMVMSPAKVTLFIGASAELSVTASDAKNNPLTPEYSWVSSNPKVAAVSSGGKVTAIAKGSATITCKALDGSGKSAKCTVTVAQPVESITITGQTSIAPGASATYKASVLPAAANNKGVIWTISAPAGITVSSTGVVKVPKTVTSGSITLKATAKDGSEVNDKFTITITPKCTAISITYENGGVDVAESKGRITSVSLFNVDLPSTEDRDESQTSLGYYTDNDNVSVAWSSSSPAVASVDESGNVTAHKAGSAKITVAAQDGSGKKATVTVKVVVPASSIAINSSVPRQGLSYYYLGFGKSATHKVTFADTYGKPTNQKVKWSYQVYHVVNGSYYTASGFDNKWVTLSSSGKLTLSAKAQAYRLDLAGDLVIRVTATTTDGTNVRDSVEYIAVKGNPTMKALSWGLEWQYIAYRGQWGYVRIPNFKGYTFSRNGECVAMFECDQWFKNGNDGYCDFIATSSNPKVASVEQVAPYDGDGTYGVVIATGNVKGSATITVKTTDGSNKSCSFTVKTK